MAQLDQGWKRGGFDVAERAGGVFPVDGWSRDNFGVFSVGGDGRSESWAYLVHLPSGTPLGLFFDKALAKCAGRIFEQLHDWSEDVPDDAEAGTQALIDAGFYVTGEHDAAGNHVWYWAQSAARDGAGTA